MSKIRLIGSAVKPVKRHKQTDTPTHCNFICILDVKPVVDGRRDMKSIKNKTIFMAKREKIKI